MGFQIEEQGANLLVRIQGSTCTEREITEAVRTCAKQSWWSCPTGECAKVGSWETHCERDEIVLTLKPRSAEPLSASGIGECMRYVLDEATTLAGRDAPAR